ncbi:hypothetical protein FOA52_015886 [Chlamydomonas sp. UWO 241]|nr:hypothetical protein FOA52_015886 [Chlamydomonas sp. UWO 241]
MDARAMAERLVRAPVDVPSVRLGEPLMTAFAGPTDAELAAYPPDAPVVVCLHSFDSSCLEFRRLYPLLAPHAPTYALDLVGWGFTDHAWLQGAGDNAQSIGPDAKRAHLRAFVKQRLGGRKLILIGASVGGAIAMDFALTYPEMVSKLVLLDPQVFIDGLGPMATLPRRLAELGVKLLQTEWLRNQAGVAAYFDKPQYATKDAVRVGRLHTFLPGWLDANVAFMRSGGYSMSRRIRDVRADTLVLWGRDDEILEGTFAERFPAELPTSRLVYVERCGHTPHLESAPFVAEQVLRFLRDGLTAFDADEDPPSGSDEGLELAAVDELLEAAAVAMEAAAAVRVWRLDRAGVAGLPLA